MSEFAHDLGRIDEAELDAGKGLAVEVNGEYGNIAENSVDDSVLNGQKRKHIARHSDAHTANEVLQQIIVFAKH